MPAGPAQPPSPEQPAEERYGPLAVERFSKEDGRALVLYVYRGDDPELGGERQQGTQAAARSAARAAQAAARAADAEGAD
jgi:hypothetical protein